MTYKSYKLLQKITIYYLLYLVFMSPYQSYLFIDTNIFPRLDLIIIFLVTLKRRANFILLFFIGIFLDYLNSTYHGMYPFILISGDLIIRKIYDNMSNINYQIKLLLFLYYLSFCIITKYLFFVILGNGNLPSLTVIFQYINTILAYPVIYLLTANSLKFVR